MLGKESQPDVHCDLENDQPEAIPVRCVRRSDEHHLVEIGDLARGGPAGKFQDEVSDGLQYHPAIVSRAVRQAQSVNTPVPASY